ncbi:hypothetical protein HDU76_002348 [Blyttiomyces sp. JEL0837]|nr:hypothetical protein HDU76_002348 [Blyttiomyces sp. JEL0837]
MASTSQQPTAPSSSSSLWDRNPPEIITAILNSSDVLTRYLNNNLSEIEIRQHASEIWNEAFNQDWPGDLTLLPSFGFPTASTGLCLVHSKSMLNRLRLLRPALDVNSPGILQDTFHITIKNNTNFGWFAEYGAPVVLMDFSDAVERGGTTIFNAMVTSEKVFTSLSSSLLHISMRNCWFEYLESYITDNPIVMLKYAIHGDHFHFLQYLVDTIKLDLAKLPIDFEEFKPYFAIAKNNNLEMFIYLHKKRCPVNHYSHKISFLTHLIDMRRLNFLQYIRGSQMVSNEEIVDVLSTTHTNYIVTDVDFWEWLLDTYCRKRFDKCRWAPIASNLNSAKRIVAKLGTVNLQTLRMNAYKTSVAAFGYLWQHRSHPDAYGFPPEIHSLEAELAICKLIDLANRESVWECSVDVYRRAHENDRVPNCYEGFVYAAIRSRNFGLLQAIHEVCKCPDLKFSSGDMDLALTLENMEAVKFLHENRLEGCSGHAFVDCITMGGLESVKFLFEHRRGDCNLEAGLDLAVRSGRLNVVKYLVGKGGKVLDESLTGCIQYGYLHTVTYLIDDVGMECTLQAMDLAVKSGSLRLVRYLRGRFPHLRVTMGSLEEVMSKNGRCGAKVQMSSPKSVVIIMASSTSTSESSLEPTSPTLQPSTSSRTSSLWDRIPSEIINIILNLSDIVTQYLNHHLTEIEFQQHATQIWHLAFREDWPGDLTLLPSLGFPTASSGLCLVHSKSMLSRLRFLRPDLDVETPGLVQDTFQVMIKDSTNFGWFTVNRPAVVALDLNDVVEPGGKPAFTQSHHEPVFKALSSALIHISMRHCWFDELDSYINQNPISLAKLAINNDHLDFLKYLVDPTRTFPIPAGPVHHTNVQLSRDVSESEPYFAAARNNNLDIFIYLHEEGCPVGNDMAKRSGMIVRELCYRVVTDDRGIVMDLDLWEWLLDTFCKYLFDICEWAPIAVNMDSAKRIVTKLGAVNFTILTMNAYKASMEVFSYLWQHRPQPGAPRFHRGIHHFDLDAEVAIWKLTDLTNVRNLRFCSAETYRRAHKDNIVPNCHQTWIWEAVKADNLDLLQAIREVCKCPDLISLNWNIINYPSRSWGNLEVVRFLHEHVSERCNERIFLDCALMGRLDLVKFLYEHGKGAYSLEAGLFSALRAGQLDVVKYLVEKGGKQNSAGFNKCVENGHLHTLKYLLEDVGVECTVDAITLAVKSGSLKLVRYLKEKFPNLKVTMDSLRGVMEKNERYGAKVQMVEFLLVHFADCLDVEMVYSEEWKDRYWESFEERVVEYLMHNGEKLRRVVEN